MNQSEDIELISNYGAAVSRISGLHSTIHSEQFNRERDEARDELMEQFTELRTVIDALRAELAEARKLLAYRAEMVVSQEMISLRAALAAKETELAKLNKIIQDDQDYHAAAVQQFNAGYTAFKDGLAEDEAPYYEFDHDEWLVGYSWAAYEKTKKAEAELAALRRAGEWEFVNVPDSFRDVIGCNDDGLRYVCSYEPEYGRWYENGRILSKDESPMCWCELPLPAAPKGE